MSVEQFAFGSRLKAHRERQGVSLADIAESTKIAPSLLASLECNDVSLWPKGIYRRAFLRSYARAIDIPFEPIWTEFIQLFPEDGAAPTTTRFAETPQLRLVLGSQRLRTPSLPNLEAAGVDVLAILVFGLVLSLLPSISAWMGIALTSLVYGVVSTAVVGESLGRWYLRAARARQAAVAASPARALVATQAEENDVDELVIADDDDILINPPAPPPLQRPRIFAVASAHAAAPGDALERRIADR